ncbi:MAG: ribosomal protein S18-alanine N-acetyltransferase [Acidobacteria bacterium]|nr:ribosomal protein S18-alanine N-acetyltransferase [Acidobacteriota bacterium]
MIIYREMVAFDLGAVQAMERAVYPDDAWSLAQFKEELAGVPRSRFYIVACEGQAIVGYAGIAITQDVADIHTLTVTPKYRRRGIGKELLRQIEGWAIEKGALSLMLEMRVENSEAEPLYEAAGYEAISERKHYYGTGVHAIIMKKMVHYEK